MVVADCAGGGEGCSTCWYLERERIVTVGLEIEGTYKPRGREIVVDAGDEEDGRERWLTLEEMRKMKR